jgi:sugar-specific transcriptional regulator TrmB
MELFLFLHLPLHGALVASTHHWYTEISRISSFFLFQNLKEVNKLSLERIFKALLSLDLSHIDAKVYMILALAGPMKKLSIVNDLKINKQQISQSLVNLQNKGMIFPDLENHNEFSALPFEKALELLIKTEKAKTQILTETKESLLSDWKTSTNKKDDTKS